MSLDSPEADALMYEKQFFFLQPRAPQWLRQWAHTQTDALHHALHSFVDNGNFDGRISFLPDSGKLELVIGRRGYKTVGDAVQRSYHFFITALDAQFPNLVPEDMRTLPPEPEIAPYAEQVQQTVLQKVQRLFGRGEDPEKVYMLHIQQRNAAYGQWTKDIDARFKSFLAKIGFLIEQRLTPKPRP